MAKFGIGDVVRVDNSDHHMHGFLGKVLADYTETPYSKMNHPGRERYYVDFTPEFATRDTLLAEHLVLVEKNTKIRKRVYYSVNYCAEIEYDPDKEDLEDAINNIDIPEGGQHNSEYQDDSFDAYEVEDA